MGEIKEGQKGLLWILMTLVSYDKVIDRYITRSTNFLWCKLHTGGYEGSN